MSSESINTNGNRRNRPPVNSLRPPGEPWAIVPVGEVITSPRGAKRKLAQALAPVNRQAAQVLLQNTVQRPPNKKLFMRTVSAGSQGPSQQVAINPALVPVPGSQGNIRFIGMVNGQQVVADPVQGTYIPTAILNEGYMSNARTGPRPSRAEQAMNKLVDKLSTLLFGLSNSQKRSVRKSEQRKFLRDFSIDTPKLRKIFKKITKQQEILSNSSKSQTQKEAARMTLRTSKAELLKMMNDYQSAVRNAASKAGLQNFYVPRPALRRNSPIKEYFNALKTYLNYPAKVFGKYFVEEAPQEPIQSAVASARGIRSAQLFRTKAPSKLERNLIVAFGNAPIGKYSAKRSLNKWAEFTGVPLPQSKNGINQYLTNLANARNNKNQPFIVISEARNGGKTINNTRYRTR